MQAKVQSINLETGRGGCGWPTPTTARAKVHPVVRHLIPEMITRNVTGVADCCLVCVSMIDVKCGQVSTTGCCRPEPVTAGPAVRWKAALAGRCRLRLLTLWRCLEMDIHIAWRQRVTYDSWSGGQACTQQVSQCVQFVLHEHVTHFAWTLDAAC